MEKFIQHRQSQLNARENLFESYQITVTNTIRKYTDREQALKDSNEYFKLLK